MECEKKQQIFEHFPSEFLINWLFFGLSLTVQSILLRTIILHFNQNIRWIFSHPIFRNSIAKNAIIRYDSYSEIVTRENEHFLVEQLCE